MYALPSCALLVQVHRPVCVVQNSTISNSATPEKVLEDYGSIPRICISYVRRPRL